MTRAARRAARTKTPQDAEGLRAALSAARLPGTPDGLVAQARGLLIAWLGENRARPFAEVARDLARGEASRAIALSLLDQTPAPPDLACASGCAFCCILTGDDGGTITGSEARALHAALAGVEGADGSLWHPKACPALDPETRLCRAYDARPLICRTYVSRDVTACEAVAEGEARPGTGTLPAQVVAITAQSLVRAALKGVAQAPTYSLRAVAGAGVAGVPLDKALKGARQAPTSLDAERKRLVRGLGAG